ncbi:hypothetical protein R80B4_00358 [Fibrobacteres bacterium R8-0-B4]
MTFFTRQGRAALIAAAVGLGLLAAGCGKKDAPATDTAAGTALADPRDGQTYKTAVIGGRTWMAQNLNYQTESGSWCYGNSADSCAKYGRLYDWETAKTVCPDGWKLPDTADWRTLVSAAGGAETAGKRLKSTSGWNRNNDDNASGDGTDDFGFSALPGGLRYSNGGFGIVGVGGYWWTATEYPALAGFRYIDYHGDYIEEDGGNTENNKRDGYSVRCMKVSVAAGKSEQGSAAATPEQGTVSEKTEQPADGAENPELFTDGRDGQMYKTVKIGGRSWMAANLNSQTNNGNDDDSRCYDNEQSNCARYGRLYTWSAAKTACPKGLRLPTRKEWQTLVDYAGGDSTAGRKLKSKNGWADDGNGTDEYGFWALPGGYVFSDGQFYNIGQFGWWWTATEYESGYAYGRRIDDTGGNAAENINDERYALSVRCIKE